MWTQGVYNMYIDLHVCDYVNICMHVHVYVNNMWLFPISAEGAKKQSHPSNNEHR